MTKLTNLILLLCASSFGATLSEVSKNGRLLVVRHDDGHVWTLKQRLCVVNENRSIGCGWVKKVTPRAVLLELDRPIPTLKVGQGLELRPSSGPKAAPKLGGRTTLLTIGAAGWNTYLYPSLSFERILFGHLSVSINPSLFFGNDGSTTLTSLGAFLALNFYSIAPYEGLWIQAGGGAFVMTVTDGATKENKSPMAWTATIGWKHRLLSDPTSAPRFGVAIGGQYIAQPNFSLIDVSMAGLQPVVKVELGISF